VASHFSTPIAIGASVAAMVLLLALNRRVRVAFADEADVTPGARMPDLSIPMMPAPEDGPVLIQIEYRIAPADRAAFLKAIHKVEATRRRNGAGSWRVFRDLEQDGLFVERFVIDSWAEYTRLRTRMTQTDRRGQEAAEKFQLPDVPIRVSRFIGIGRDDLAAPV
jgi:quinol monooxygenase YgiN